MTLTNGQVYDGEWKDDKRHGKGKMTLTSGQVYVATWKETRPQRW